ncbi:respiratory chain complex I subunit 1 family protein [Effusibacillus lacus]|uniref:Formate hydrogenlyase n=1 Tax=Effusibacillus lacus TaxID=1348429 RepID=A0A292YLQ1_9BACL|nr:NADH-quinone oxidoreductase subunit H [Effusibacillus lacus]TCS71215.1 formate hydrogenlyase subunit 4 [Effusibacillus lacus]GAX89841.1 formate hydrogenlyase [Effusibacillus lacus]
MSGQIGWTIGWTSLQVVTLLLVAPLIQGTIKKIKARLQNRIGPSVLQPYYDLMKYMKKDAVVSGHASWLTVATPYIVFIAILTAGLLVPTFMANTPLGFVGDMILIVYLFGLARFFTALTALDAGSSFGGMGSSREMALSAIAEPALLLAAFAVFLSGGTTKLHQLIQVLATHGWNWIEPSYVLAFLAMFIVVIAETGRIPVDNPDTHLELTMIHEGMLLEYSGRYLGLMMWAAQIKQLLILSLFINLFFPWGIAVDWNVSGIFLSFLLYLIKLVGLGIGLAFIETLYAKIRIFIVPKLLVSSMILSLLAILVRVVE